MIGFDHDSDLFTSTLYHRLRTIVTCWHRNEPCMIRLIIRSCIFRSEIKDIFIKGLLWQLARIYCNSYRTLLVSIWINKVPHNLVFLQVFVAATCTWVVFYSINKNFSFNTFNLFKDDLPSDKVFFAYNECILHVIIHSISKQDNQLNILIVHGYKKKRYIMTMNSLLTLMTHLLQKKMTWNSVLQVT